MDAVRGCGVAEKDAELAEKEAKRVERLRDRRVTDLDAMLRRLDGVAETQREAVPV